MCWMLSDAAVQGMSGSSKNESFSDSWYVVVQPGPRPASGPCGTNRFVFNSRTMQLDWIAARARELGVEMYVLRPCAWTGEEWDEAIRTEWLRRVGGEAGRDWFRGATSLTIGTKAKIENSMRTIKTMLYW